MPIPREATVRCCWVLLVSDAINRTNFSLEIWIWSGKYPFVGLAAPTYSNFQIQLKPWRLSQSNNSNESSTARRSLSTSGLWTWCPFKELEGRQRTASRRGSVRRQGMDSCRTSVMVLWRTYGSTVCPSPPIRPLPLLPFSRRSWLLSLRPLPNVNLLSPEPSETYAAELKVQFFQVWQINLKLVSSYREVQQHAKSKFSW